MLVRAAPGVSQETLAARVRAAVPASARAETITGAQLTKENLDAVTSGGCIYSGGPIWGVSTPPPSGAPPV